MEDRGAEYDSGSDFIDDYNEEAAIELGNLTTSLLKQLYRSKHVKCCGQEFKALVQSILTRYGQNESFFEDLIKLFEAGLSMIYFEWKAKLDQLVKELRLIKPKRNFSSDDVVLHGLVAKS